MANPVRDLGRIGIIKDRGPYDIPINAWSGGNNVRFHDDKVMRAPVFREIDSGITPQKPVLVHPVYQSDQADFLVVVGHDGRLFKWVGGVETEVTPTGFTPAVSDVPFTGCTLGNVVYVNRKTDVPYYYGPGSTEFQALPGWDPTWKVRVIRAYKDFVIGLNLSKGSVDYPATIKWSHNVLSGAPPSSWDETDPEKNAGENTFAEMTSEILDGLTLGNTFYIYGRDQVQQVTFIGGRLIFDFRKKFDNVGIINTNCVVEVDGKHFVFGPDDIWAHDGTTKVSICDGRVRRFIYQNLNNKLTNRCFVAHNPRLKEIMFCYVSGDDDVTWRNTVGCNKAAVYSYHNDTWGFMDLPSVLSAAYVECNQILSWDTAPGSWEDIGGTWYGQEDGGDRQLIVAGVQDPNLGFATSALLGLDSVENGTMLAYPLYAPAATLAWVERIGLDLDELDEIRGYKVIPRIFPQAKIFDVHPLKFRTGGTLYSGADVTWGNAVEFDPRTDYKVDVRSGGRYLALRCEMDAQADFEFSGYDPVIVVTGRR